MDANEAIGIANAFLLSKRIGHCPPVRTIQADSGGVEVIFTVPEALDPDVVVDPPEVRVLVYADGRKTELLPDM